jgi:HTH-type transcriptional regulator / antitoxin HigA
MKTSKTTRRAADDYLALVRKFPLRPIRSEKEYDEAIGVLKSLVARADAGLTAGERDYTDALDRFVGDYDARHYPLDFEDELKTPLERLKFLLELHGMNTTDLGRLLGSGQGQASLILNGKRDLSKANIRVLAARFKVNAGLFL